MTLANPEKLVRHLCAQSGEADWFEFKKNFFDPEDLGQYISALANSAMLAGRSQAYLVYGVDNATHEIVGTDIRLQTKKVKGEDLEHWLLRLLNPKINFSFVGCRIDGKRVEIVHIEPAYDRPLRFENIAYIRVNSHKKRLIEYPEKERTLWELTSRFAFEDGIADQHLSKEDVFERFHCKKLAELIYPSARTKDEVFAYLVSDGLIVDDMQGGYDVTNLFAICAAKNMLEFRTLANKTPRVIVYQGKSKITGVSDKMGQRGYAVSFERLLNYVLDRVPGKETIRHGVRKQEFQYPEKAVREFLANCLIHQDFIIGDGRPTVEIYSDKIQITNPGKSLVDLERLIDAPAKSRNEKLAALMRRAGSL